MTRRGEIALPGVSVGYDIQQSITICFHTFFLGKISSVHGVWGTVRELMDDWPEYDLLKDRGRSAPLEDFASTA